MNSIVGEAGFHIHVMSGRWSGMQSEAVLGLGGYQLEMRSGRIEIFLESMVLLKVCGVFSHPGYPEPVMINGIPTAS